MNKKWIITTIEIILVIACLILIAKIYVLGYGICQHVFGLF